MHRQKFFAYLDEIPRTPVTIRRSCIFFLPSFTNINPVEKCVIPVTITFIQVLKEAYTLIKAPRIDVPEVTFHIHGFMVPVNLYKNEAPCMSEKVLVSGIFRDNGRWSGR